MSKKVYIEPDTIVLKPKAMLVFEDKSRWKILIAGRRFGKTKYSSVEIIDEVRHSKRKVAFVAPSLPQAKKILIGELLDILGTSVKGYNQQENVLNLLNGSELHVYSADNYERARGNSYNLVIFDEAAQIPEKAWTEVFRASLSTTKGRAIFIGTPRGKSSWLYDLTLNPKWSVHQYTSADGGWIPYEEILEAESMLDKRTFDQEYNASFESQGNTVYDSFTDKNIIPASKCKFDKNKPVIMAWDFNVNPLCCVILQKNNLDHDIVIKEFYMNHTKTFDGICQVREWLLEQGIQESEYGTKITCYGDYAGNQSKSSASKSDWEIIQAEMKNFNFKLDVIPTKTIKDRCLSLNTRLCNARGERNLYVSSDCKNLIRDFRKVEWKENSFTLEDKDKTLTHISDALSYYTNRVYPTYFTKTETKYY